MSMARRKDGRFIVKYKDMGGRWKQRSFCREEEARQFDAECRYDAMENSRLSLLEAVLAYLKNNSHAPKTIELYEFLICGHDRKDGSHREGPAEILASRFADTLTRMDLETVRENCRNSGMAAATINLYTGKLKAALNWCVEQDLLHENPWAKYRNIPGARHKTRAGTLEDFARLYPHLPPWMQWAAETAVALCLRPGMSELFSLEWTAFDWQNGAVSVFMPKVGKTKLAFPPRDYLRKAWQRFRKDRETGQKLVCRNGKNQKATAGQYQYAWHQACERAGVHIPMYALRHIAASCMLANGADLAAVAAQLGHANITTTATFYTHALTSAQRHAATTLPTSLMVQHGAENNNIYNKNNQLPNPIPLVLQYHLLKQLQHVTHTLHQSHGAGLRGVPCTDWGSGKAKAYAFGQAA